MKIAFRDLCNYPLLPTGMFDCECDAFVSLLFYKGMGLQI